MIEAYPLSWPVGWKRTEPGRRGYSKFHAEFGRARDGLIKEIQRMGGTKVVLSTNIPITREGLPYAKHAQPQDPGVAVYFERRGKAASLACDRWRTVGENIRALQLTVEAMRGIERWGSSEIMERTFTGFMALPAPEGATPAGWREVFELGASARLDEVKSKRNELLRRYHPDIGTEPSHERMTVVNKAYEQAERELN